MRIIININEKNKEFEIGPITGRLMLEYARIADLSDDVNNLMGNQAHFYIDRCNFIVDCFKKQFTLDELLDGCEAADIELITAGILNYISEKTEKKIAKISKN